ncbi:hypothetical protein BH09PSE6_BH09PSE6_16060 [soil metagenome]
MRSSRQLQELLGARSMTILLLILSAPVLFAVLGASALLAYGRLSDDPSLRVIDVQSFGDAGRMVQLIETGEVMLGVHTYALYRTPIAAEQGTVDPVLLTYGAIADRGPLPSLSICDDQLIVTAPGLQWVRYRQHAIVGADRVLDIVAVSGPASAAP